MTSCLGREEGMEGRWKGSYQGNVKEVVLELNLEKTRGEVSWCGAWVNGVGGRWVTAGGEAGCGGLQCWEPGGRER